MSQSYEGQKVQMVVRVKQGERFVLANGGWTVKGEPSTGPLMRRLPPTAELEWKGSGEPTPYLEIQATISDPKGKAGRTDTPSRSR